MKRVHWYIVILAFSVCIGCLVTLRMEENAQSQEWYEWYGYTIQEHNRALLKEGYCQKYGIHISKLNENSPHFQQVIMLSLTIIDKNGDKVITTDEMKEEAWTNVFKKTWELIWKFFVRNMT